ncbi:fibronectin type III domain-containing protein [Capnocytophaga cynodegmi]|uniref:fibronectin type III domain-containing protein n=1 Tax=Capnocytophaga cynodegmi TaxID=28189 RepID=UPI00385898F7
MRYIKYVILVWIVIQSSFLKAQQYPVDVQLFVTPPYQQSLRDYWATFEPKMQVYLLLKDLNSPIRNVALGFSLENVQGQPLAQTASYAFPFQTQLTSGVRKNLSNIDLKSLFAFENLQGVSEHFYNDLLPEGAYFMCFTAYDVATQTPLSAKARTLIQIRRYTPPLPTLPAKGEIISKKNQFQHLTFQWMLRDPAPFTQYEFTLKEVWDNSLSPEEAFISGRLVYQGNVLSNTILYGPDKPILLENKRYVWKVRAFTQNPNNPNQRQSFFHNEGNSEAFYFDYVSHCEAPKFLTAITKDNTANIRWSGEPPRASISSVDGSRNLYKILYREKGKNWKSQMSNHPQATLIGLKRGRNYVYKVGVACGLGGQTQSTFSEQTYLYSTEQEFVTPHKQNDSASVQCGVKPEIRIRNREPLQEVLGVNETFVAGDFPVTVLRATGSNGVFSGEGYVQVPYLLDTKIKVKFDGIKINSERQLFEGKLVTTYDKTEKNVQFIQEGIGEVFGDAGVKTNKIDFEIAEIKKDANGRVVVIGKPDKKTGITPQITLPVGSDYQLSDASGKTWTLDEQGEVTSVGEKADTKLAQNQGKNNLPKGQPKPENFEIQWDFSQSAFAFDASGEIPYKALVKSKNDVFQVVIKQKDTLRYSFHFQTDKGLKVESKREKEGVFEISRKGLFDFGDEELWVVAKNTKTEKEEVIGKCMLVHLSEKEVNVTLIPTAENLQIDIDAIQRIYAKVGVKLHISTDEIFPVKETIDTKNAFGDLSTYSPEQQAIIAWYKSERATKPDTYYVFVGKQEGSQVGYMRLGGQFGFALDGNSRTIAHELGHGIFKLEHPFKKDVTKKGTFRTLMDYAQETTFAYSDWKQINDPKLKIYAFQGQSQGEHNIYAHLGLTPDGTIFDKFYLKDSPISVIIKVSPEQYTINEIEYKGQAYRWNTQIAGFVNSGEVIIAKKIQKTIDKVNIYRSRKDGGCSYDYLTIAWSQQDKNATNIVERINSHIKRYSEKDWKIAPFTIRDDSCNKNFFAELLKRDSENCNYTEIEEGTNALRNLSQKDNIEANVIVMQINSFCVGAIRNLQYKEIEKLFDVVASQESIKEHAEVALLRLMTGIKTQDYSLFYTYLEANNNKVIKHLVKEIDDASIYFWADKDNYTNFTGALVWMLNKSPELIAKKWEVDNDISATKVVNLTPEKYSSDFYTNSSSYISKYNDGIYDENTGNITLYDVYTTYVSNIHVRNGSTKQREEIGIISPLTPIIIIPEKGKIPLVESALGEFDFGNGYYVVPAIFLKYNADKIRNDYIEKGIVTTLDVATIALSGGTALATKVHWVRRAWALAEVVGATGNIVVSNTEVSADTKQIVDAYNLAMAGIGIKNLGQGGYKFVKNLPEQTKKLLQQNKGLRNELVAKYLEWKTLTTNIDNLTDAEKQLIAQQEKVWKMLGVVDNLDNVTLYINNLFKGSRQRAIAKFGKEGEDLIYIKFNKDGGAAAEIIDHYGIEGLNALKKVDNIDDVAKELVKNKTVYRAVNETTYNFDKLKTQGIIDASPEQHPTYVSLDNYSNADVIKSKLQLPKKPTWVAEFDGNQIIGDVRLPKGKYLTAEYREVLCKSYPDLGEGGGSQFITNSPIKVKRLVNLETGEIINFK